jgi:hypothetical protein
MKKTDKLIPKFENEDEERKFWATHSPLDYFDSGNIKRVLFSNLKPSLKLTSIRLPEDMRAELKTLPKRPYPKFGSAAGLIEMSDDFDEPLEDLQEYMP